MKKIFRMQYEPCLGTCYQYDKELMSQFLKLSNEEPTKLNDLLTNLEYIHDKTCGNKDLGFILDYDEGLMIGTFISPTGSQSFVGKTINEVYIKFRTLIDWHYKQNPQTTAEPENCDHGRDDNIIEWTLEQLNKHKQSEGLNDIL